MQPITDIAAVILARPGLIQQFVQHCITNAWREAGMHAATPTANQSIKKAERT
ncbi:predicted protein [Uncinocarpus reesii 1704]|uniref:Uncharacterized protein n=1 Tax=Uncinocarpus reesii (strain UAMH 1704) TaxID=336963 RepID=C4RRN9_UNCRE|nr:predicted protein [Uncinocarpus reesii 1704]